MFGGAAAAAAGAGAVVAAAAAAAGSGGAEGLVVRNVDAVALVFELLRTGGPPRADVRARVFAVFRGALTCGGGAGEGRGSVNVALCCARQRPPLMDQLLGLFPALPGPAGGAGLSDLQGRCIGLAAARQRFRGALSRSGAEGGAAQTRSGTLSSSAQVSAPFVAGAPERKARTGYAHSL